MAWESRIIGLEKQPANQLLAHPYNARRHPSWQRDALRASLNTLGVVAPVIVNQRTGHVLDGHARVEEYLAKDEHALVDVLLVDVEPEQEAQFLATFDYITYMAEFDKDILSGLLEKIDISAPEMEALIKDLQQAENLIMPDEWPEYDESIAETVEYHECPNCGHKWPK